jgi:uncharacterized membrane-anchored protein YitT (DUF2179 family)
MKSFKQSLKNIKITRKDVKEFCKLIFVLNLLAFIRSFTTYMFIVPNGFGPGGITGIASIIYNAVYPFNPHLADTVLNPAITSMVLNVPLFIASFFLLDKKFCLYTIIAVGLHSLWMGVLDIVDFPVYKAIGSASALNLLAAGAGGVGSGVCLGFILRYNSSMGGTDIIGKLIYKFNPVADVQWLILACDIVVVIASGTLGLIGLDFSLGAEVITTSVLSPILYSAISLLVGAEIADVIQAGLQSSVVFNIISDKHDEIAVAINEKLHRGATRVHATGSYTGVQHDMLVVVVRKKQINQVKEIIFTIDPDAFMYMTKAKGVTGKGFSYHGVA